MIDPGVWRARCRHASYARRKARTARGTNTRSSPTSQARAPSAGPRAWPSPIGRIGGRNQRPAARFARAIAAATWSAVDCGHVRLVVALAGGGGEIVEPLDLLRAQLDAVGGRVLLDAGDALGAGDRGEVVALREQPGQSDLRRCGVDLGGNGLDLVDDAEVLLEVALCEARVGLAPVVVARAPRGSGSSR